MSENGLFNLSCPSNSKAYLTAYQLDRDNIVSLWRLTPRECDIALQLLSGKSLKTISAELGISYETARWNLKNILTKVNVHSQIQLVIKLARVTKIDYTECPIDFK